MPSRIQELEDRIAELEEENAILLSKLEEFGEDFTMAFLHDFANNPSDSKFGLLRQVLVDLTKAARKKLREVDEQLKEVEVGAGER